MNFTVGPNSVSADITVTRNAIFSIVTDNPIVMEAKNLNDNSYVEMAPETGAAAAVPYIAPSTIVRIRNKSTSKTAVCELG